MRFWKWNETFRRSLAGLLAAVMLFGMFPGIPNVHAEEEAAVVEAVVWEVGTIASADGQNNQTNTRLRTADYLLLEDYGGVGIGKGYTMTNFVYDAEYNYLGTSSWIGNGMSFTTTALREQYPNGMYFRVALRALDQSTLTVEDIPAIGVKFYAPGETIPQPESSLKYTDVGKVGSWQDGAIYDGKLFVFGGAGTGAVYDLDSLEKLGAVTLDNKDILKPHANSVCFGSTYYAEGDQYPLLYVNIYNNYASAVDRMEGTCCVYRVTESDGQFTTELVQVIRIGFTEDLTLWKSKENNGDVRPYGNFVVDTDHDKLYAFVMRDADKTTRFFKFSLPALTEGTYSETYGCNVVTLENADIESQFDTAYFNYLQGCCYHDGQILSVEGFNSGGSAEPALRIIDLSQQKLTATYYPAEAGLAKEPEVICVDPDDGTMYYAAADGILRALELELSHTHNYYPIVTAPTCTDQGYTTHTCKFCGDSYQNSYTAQVGHSYQDGVCVWCGKQDPDASDYPDHPAASNWPLLNTDLTHIICYGQSFSNGSDAPYYADPTVDGVYVFGNIANSTNGTELTPLTDSARNQHPIISAGNAFAQLLAEAGYDTDLVLGSYGTGGKTIAQLMSAERQAQIKEEEGYTYDILSSGRYAVFQSSVAALASYADKTQQSISCPVIVYLQGETDQNTDAQLGYPDNPIRAGYGAGGDKEKYKEYMSRLKEDMQQEVMEAYGQTEQPLFIIYQVSGTYVRTRYSAINMAQLEFAQENEDVILVQTPYFAPHYTSSHHLTVNGYRWMGEYIAQSMYTALVEREKPWPMVPSKFSIESNTEIRITVDGAQNGLCIDTWTVENATNGNNLYGFNVWIDGTTVKPSSVEVSGNEILLTLPDGYSLTSAESVCVQYGGQKASGTGNIRDNCEKLGFYDYLDDSADTGTGNNQGVSHSALDEDANSIIGKKYPLYNWLVSFSYEIKTNSLHVHSYEETVVEPSCIYRGYTAYACTCGDYYADSYVAATGIHSYEAVVTPPTCTEAGYTTHICICGAILQVDGKVEPLGHAEVIDPNVLPTAEKTGLTQGFHCERCQEVLTAQQVIPAKGYASTLEDGAFKVLLIGNTFSEDAANFGQGMTTSQLLDILQAMLGEDVSVTVGLIHASATSMAWHATQAERDTAKYNLRIIDSETETWKTVGAVTSAYALQWADWDAVVLQPFSTEAIKGTANPIHADQEDAKFYPLESSTSYMLDHVHTYAPDAEIYCFMHWQRTKTNKINVYLGAHNTMAEFFPTVMTYRGTNSGARYSDIIPVGTAIQNARTTYLALLSYNPESSVSLKNDPQFGLQRDENHLSLNVGRYIAALTFAETIVPAELRAEGYAVPEIRITESVGKLPREYTLLAQKAVQAAIENWQKGSLSAATITGYEQDPTVAAGQTLSALTLEIPCASDPEALQSFIREAILAALPEDFAVDAVDRTKGADIGDAFACDVTIRFGYTSLKVTVSCAVTRHTPGDINGDGSVDNKDLTRLFRHLSGYDVQVVEAALDVNGDGSINNKDQTRLFRYLSGWDVEIC